MSYSLDRSEAALRLGVSSRTIDRHIQSGRIRTKRIGKKIFLEELDIESLRNQDPARKDEDYVVVVNSSEESPSSSTDISPSLEKISHADMRLAITEFSRIYTEAQDAIHQKDTAIRELSYKLGKVETELKNSIDISEYKRTSYLLESAKAKNTGDMNRLQETITELEKEVQKRTMVISGLVVVFVLLLTFSGIVFFTGNYF